MAAGFGLLRLSPDAFWTMTLTELSAALGAYSGAASGPLARSDLTQLMQNFPDHLSSRGGAR
ncbi:phage tail assembly chaperone [Leptospira interrogans]